MDPSQRNAELDDFRVTDLSVTAVGSRRKIPGLEQTEETVGMIGVHYLVIIIRHYRNRVLSMFRASFTNSFRGKGRSLGKSIHGDTGIYLRPSMATRSN